MERVVVLGPGGAGKSELATRIAGRTGLPIVHLDHLRRYLESIEP
jgi:adenylate kinase family enzyme